MKPLAWILALLTASLLCAGYRSAEPESVEFFLEQLKTICGTSKAGEPPKVWEIFDDELARVLGVAHVNKLKLSSCKSGGTGKNFQLLFSRKTETLSMSCSFGKRLGSKFELACTFPGLELFPDRMAPSIRSHLDASCQQSLGQKEAKLNFPLTHCKTNEKNELESVREAPGLIRCSTTKTFVGEFVLNSTCELLPLKEIAPLEDELKITKSQMM